MENKYTITDSHKIIGVCKYNTQVVRVSQQNKENYTSRK